MVGKSKGNKQENQKVTNKKIKMQLRKKAQILVKIKSWLKPEIS
jgi:hypothetical protein